MNVAFCCDQFALPGLYLSIYTLLDSNPGAPLNLFLIHEGLSNRALECLQRSVQEARPNVKLTIREFSTTNLRFAKGFFGNYMPYARLFLADLLPEIHRIIYLDSDLLVNCTIAELWQIKLEDCLIGAVPGGSLERSVLDRDFLLEIGLPKTATCFNSGVLLLDLAGWRAKQTTKACLDFLATYPDRSQMADQTLLNALFSEHYVQIPNKFNVSISRFVPSYRDGLPPGIFHFDANPKPWDFLGRQFHNNWVLFDDACRRLEIPRRTGDFLPRVVRTVRIARSYARVFQIRLTKKVSGSRGKRVL